jgi:hypothetical protein
MSTKKLSRSLREAKRTTHDKFEGDYYNKRLRVKERAYLSDLKKNLDNSDEIPTPKREVTGKRFCWLNLNPAFRFLQSNTGRPWNDVYSELCEKLPEIKDIASSLSYWIEVTPRNPPKSGELDEDYTTSYYKYTYYVDGEGILRRKNTVRRKHFESFDTNKICSWLKGRVVGYNGKKLYWYIPVSSSAFADEWKCEWSNSYYGSSSYGTAGLQYLKRYYEPVYANGAVIGRKEAWYPYEYHSRHPNFNCRQYVELSDKDLEFWNQLPEFYKNEILRWSPNYVKPPKTHGW